MYELWNTFGRLGICPTEVKFLLSRYVKFVLINGMYIIIMYIRIALNQSFLIKMQLFLL